MPLADANEEDPTAEDRFNEILNRPPECLSLDMELKTALEGADAARCRELLRSRGKWLGKFQSHELAELLDSAIRGGNAASELVDILLQAGVAAGCVYDYIGPSYQHTPVVTAAKLGRLDLIQKLVAAGADLFWTSPTGANVLSEIIPSRATQAPKPDTPETLRVREWLTQMGLRIDPLCADSRRKLIWASAQPASWPDIPALLQIGIPLDVIGWTPFMLQIACGGADAESPDHLDSDDLNRRDTWKRTPFLLAVQGGHFAMARALLELGSDLQAKSHCGATGLHLAATQNHCALLEWLLEEGLDLATKDEFGCSALKAAVNSNSIEAARLLLTKGADVFERDENDYGLIHAASFSNDNAMIELLLNAGADVNDVSGGGSWPLHDACEQGHAITVAYLLQRGAKPDLTSTGKTALFAAVSSDSLECVRQLLNAGADVNATDCDQWTCLFHLQSETLAKFLLEHGANPGLPDQCGGLPENWESIPLSTREILRDWRNRPKRKSRKSISPRP
ncbi:MAG: ankyrin repeat domain-containing protein [Burkholderiales bacterium]|nr:ankyrin repeat domain-containing protein [Opitutaceae bacterium]